jgi:phosphomevalonate kinase
VTFNVHSFGRRKYVQHPECKQSEPKFSIKKLNDVQVKQRCLEILNGFAALESLDAELDIERAWKTIRENIKISAKKSLGYYKLKKRNP